MEASLKTKRRSVSLTQIQSNSSSSIRLLNTPYSFRLVIQVFTHVVLVLLLRRLFILRRKVKVNQAGFNFRRVSGIGVILILDDSAPSLDAVSRNKKLG